MTAEPSTAIDAGAGVEREGACIAIDRLIATYRDAVSLLEATMMTQRSSAALELLAGRAVDRAAALRDEESIDRAIAATAAASRAFDREDRCAVDWALHRMAADEAIAHAEDVLRSLRRAS